MSYPYPRLFLDIRLAKKRLERYWTRRVAWLMEPRMDLGLAETCPTGARLTELFYAVSKQEPARAVFSGVAIERIRPTVGRSIVAKANSPGEVAQMCLLRNSKCC
jgi:hypothetical protein